MFDLVVVDRASSPLGQFTPSPNDADGQHTVQVDTRTLVGELKVAIIERLKLPREVLNQGLLRLTFSGRTLDDDSQLLGSYGVHKGTPAHVIASRSTAPLTFFQTSDGLTMTMHSDEVCNDFDTLHEAIDSAMAMELKREMLERVRELAIRETAERTSCSDAAMSGASTPAIETVMMPAELLANRIDMAVHGQIEQPLSTIWAVGGIHGNEVVGIEGTRLLDRFLRSAQPYSKLCCHVLQHSRIVVIPCINVVGNLASARCCPAPGVEVAYAKADPPFVVVGPHERGAISPPAGWSDPNRGWQSNKTIVKQHIDVLLDGPMRPSVTIWNHDWAVPQGKLYPRGDGLEPMYNGIELVFARHFQSKTVFGAPWPFVETAEESAADGPTSTDEMVMTSELVERGIPSYTIETYCGSKTARMHTEANLFLLARHTGYLADKSTEVLVAEIGRDVDRMLGQY